MGKAVHHQRSFSGGVMSESMFARDDIKKYSTGLKKCVNFLLEVHGALRKRPGMLRLSELCGSAAAVRLEPFVYAVNDSYTLAFVSEGANTTLKIFRGDTLDAEYPAILPYSTAELYEFDFTQSADVMFLVHEKHAPRTLCRNADGSWQVEVMSFTPELNPPSGVTATPDGFTEGKTVKVKYAVSAVSAAGIESLVAETSYIDIREPWQSGATVAISWDAVPDASEYLIYKDSRGYFGFIGRASSGTTFTDDYIEEASDDGPKELENPFKDGNYPGAVGIYQQRLVFARSDRERQNIWMTASGTTDLFTVSRPQKENDSVTFKVDSRQSNEIYFMLPMEKLIVLTGGSELTVSGGGENAAITPKSIVAKTQSYWGCSRVRPVICGKSVLFAGRHGKRVRDLAYALSVDGYDGGDLTVLASNLFDSPVKSWCYRQFPDSTLFVVLESGRLLSMAYFKEHEIWGWTEHETAGRVIDVCSVPGAGQDELFLAVERFGKIWFERLSRDDEKIYLDWAEKLSNANEITLPVSAGGAVLKIVDAGSYIGDAAPDAGSTTHYTLSKNVSGYAGLPYRSELATLDPELSSNGQDKLLRKRILKAALKLNDTLGVTVSANGEKYTEVLPPGAGTRRELFSGDKSFSVNGAFNQSATLYLRQDTPYPLNILSITLELEIGS